MTEKRTRERLLTPSRKAYRSVVFGFWIAMSIGVLGLWIVSFASGRTWERGLFDYQDGNIPIFHLVAECGMSVIVLVGVEGWRRQARWGQCVAVFGAGMFGYSAVNSLGWAIHNAPLLMFPMCLSWVGVALMLTLAIREDSSDAAPAVGTDS